MKPPPRSVRSGGCAGTITSIGGVVGIGAVCAAAAPANSTTKAGTSRRCIGELAAMTTQVKSEKKHDW